MVLAEDDGFYYSDLRKIQKSLEQCWLHIKSYRCVNIYENNCCLALALEYHIIVSVCKPVAFCYSYKKYINIAERNQQIKVELIIFSFKSIMTSQKDFKVPPSLNNDIT